MHKEADCSDSPRSSRQRTQRTISNMAMRGSSRRPRGSERTTLFSSICRRAQGRPLQQRSSRRVGATAAPSRKLLDLSPATGVGAGSGRPDPGWRGQGWAGSCSTNHPPCSLHPSYPLQGSCAKRPYPLLLPASPLPASPLPASSLWQEAVVSAGNHQAPQPAAPPPAHPYHLGKWGGPRGDPDSSEGSGLQIKVTW